MQLEQEELEDVEEFYLGSVVDQQGSSDADIKTRLEKAITAFIKLRNIWSSISPRLRMKMRNFKSNESVLLYAAVTWRTRSTTVSYLMPNNTLSNLWQQTASS